MAKELKGVMGVYVALSLALVSGGVAWGVLKSEAGEAARATDRNAIQIEKLTDQLSDLGRTQAIINQRTQRIELEQREIRDDIKLLLRRQITRPEGRGD